MNVQYNSLFISYILYYQSKVWKHLFIIYLPLRKLIKTILTLEIISQIKTSEINQIFKIVTLSPVFGVFSSISHPFLLFFTKIMILMMFVCKSNFRHLKLEIKKIPRLLKTFHSRFSKMALYAFTSENLEYK